MASIIRAIAVLSVGAAFHASPAPAALVINEVLYDPEGPDRGFEFVELMNTGPYSAPLDGLELESGNGSRPSDWKTIWIARGGEWIQPGGFYAIGAKGPGDGDSSEVSLQNGPDGVRLVRSDFVLDRLGWGDLVHAEYAEGRPAASVGAGFSLARREDGRDTDDNATDFEPAVPSPGRPNRPRDDWALRTISVQPDRPRPGEPILLRLKLFNLGRSEAEAPAVELRAAEGAIEVRFDRSAPPAAFLEQPVLLRAPDRTGRASIRGSIRGADEVPENDADSIRFQVGAGPLRITEILADPGPQGSEWIEIAIDAERWEGEEGWSLDVRGRRIGLAPRLWRETAPIVILAEDSTLVRARFTDLPAGVFWPYSGGWPRLRNEDGGHGVADSLRLRAPDGVVEEIALPGRAPATGVSLERIEGDLAEGPAVWAPCADRAGATPGRASPHRISVESRQEEILRIEPRRLRPGREACRIEARIGVAAGKCDLTLVDLMGRTVRCLLREVWASGTVIASWDGLDESNRAVPPGIYIAHLAVSASGGKPVHHRAAVAVSE